jgi:hypothetical protein
MYTCKQPVLCRLDNRTKQTKSTLRNILMCMWVINRVIPRLTLPSTSSCFTRFTASLTSPAWFHVKTLIDGSPNHMPKIEKVDQRFEGIGLTRVACRPLCENSRRFADSLQQQGRYEIKFERKNPLKAHSSMNLLIDLLA